MEHVKIRYRAAVCILDANGTLTGVSQWIDLATDPPTREAALSRAEAFVRAGKGNLAHVVAVIDKVEVDRHVTVTSLL